MGRWDTPDDAIDDIGEETHLIHTDESIGVVPWRSVATIGVFLPPMSN